MPCTTKTLNEALSPIVISLHEMSRFDGWLQKKSRLIFDSRFSFGLFFFLKKKTKSNFPNYSVRKCIPGNDFVLITRNVIVYIEFPIFFLILEFFLE